MASRTVAVIDIGKTNAKVLTVDLDTLAEGAARRMPNRVIASGPYPHFDTEALWRFMLESLSAIARQSTPDAIVVTAHGASGALLAADGSLAMPVLDYEHDGPDSVAADYRALRPDFAESGSPPLPVGLNLGAQFHWQAKAFPQAFARVVTILTYPQYWAHRLCGVAANEPTSLGAHSDLWNPQARDFSSLVDRMGWRRLMAPVRRASDTLGTLLPAVAAATGLPEGTPVVCGIHDSNASLYPHLLSRATPFSVVSTGTWVIMMSVGAAPKILDPARDTLMNVNAFGDPVPSARFMGGREFALALGDDPPIPTSEEIAEVLRRQAVLTPSIDPGSGPFQNRAPAWIGTDGLTPGARTAVVSFYLAMMAATGLGLLDAEGDIVVEGPFGANGCFVRMLATATGRTVVVPGGTTGTSVGAALLALGPEARIAPSTQEQRIMPDAALAPYAARWRIATAARD
jgi:sugar (pentulose or hexulose) kinase